MDVSRRAAISLTKVIDLAPGEDSEVARRYLKGPCTFCGGGHPLFWGSGPSDAKIMVVASRPSDSECESGSTDTNLLEKVWLEAGIDRADIFYTVASRCCSAPKEELVQAMESWLPYLLYEISELRPMVIVTMGNRVFKTLTKERWIEDITPPVVSAVVKNSLSLYNISVIPTLHPRHWINMEPGQSRDFALQKMISDWSLAGQILNKRNLGGLKLI